METLNFSTAKKNNSDKMNQLFTDNGVFWAFNNEQFAEGQKTLKEGDKLISIGGGGYMPKSNSDKLDNELAALKIEFRKLILDNNLQESEILYHLCNYEAFYSNDLSDTMDTIGEFYSQDEVLKVYYANMNEYA